MIVIIFLSGCIAILILAITFVVFYSVKIISEPSDDGNLNDSLTLDAHPPPGVSPEPIEPDERRTECTNVNHNHLHHHRSGNRTRQTANEDETRNGNKFQFKTVATPIISNLNSIDTAKFAPSDASNSSNTSKTSKSTKSSSTHKRHEDGKNLDSSTLSSKQTSSDRRQGKEFDDFDARDVKLGGTGLHWCKTRKSLEKLIKFGIPLDSFNDRHETALHVAVRRRKLQILIGLLCHGAKVDLVNDIGQTALMLACKLNDLFACQLLLVFDADVDIRDDRNLSARHYAANECSKFDSKQQQLPNAAHLILAMLHEMGAERCDSNTPVDCNLKSSINNQQTSDARTVGAKSLKSSESTTGVLQQCCVGCSQYGNYNGNSYNRWADLSEESLYKRFMFQNLIDDLLDDKKKRERKNDSREQADQSEIQPRKLASETDSESLGSVETDGVDFGKKSRILCIDGGGMRGVIVCQTMIELQKYLKRPILDYFDWIGGTSVGAFLACDLSLGTPLQVLRRISFDIKDEVFCGNKPYNSNSLERVLKRSFGLNTRMSAIKDRKLVITTVIADREPCQLLLLRNYKSPADILDSFDYPPGVFISTSAQSNLVNARERAQSQQQSATKHQAQSSNSKKGNKNSNNGLNAKEDGSNPNPNPNSNPDPNSIPQQILNEHDQDPIIWQAVRASAAAPFFFKPYGPYLDGGIISNNPTIDLLTEFYTHEQLKCFLAGERSFLRKLDDEQIESVHDIGSNSNEKKVRKFIKLEPKKKLALVVSFGTGRTKVTGRQAVVDFSNITAGFSTVFSPVELVRSIRAVRDLFKKIMQQSCQTEDHILDRAQAWCSSLKVPYFRINPPLANVFSIDDKRDEQVINALWQTKLYMRQMDGQLKQLAKLLDDER